LQWGDGLGFGGDVKRVVIFEGCPLFPEEHGVALADPRLTDPAPFTASDLAAVQIEAHDARDRPPASELAMQQAVGL